MKMYPLRNKLVLIVGLGVVVLFSVVAYAASSTILGVGINANSQIIDGPATMTARRLTISAGEVGGWHYHPGLITAVVTRGTVTVEDGCGGAETFTAGQAFEKNDGRVHRAINPGSVEEEEYNMFIMPQGSPFTVNIPGNQRLCGPPKVADECKDNGWMNFNFPQAFNNQGECVSFIAARK
ncbi:MAG: cupin domain-containing protein [Pyrinomonadaceae bacterium]